MQVTPAPDLVLIGHITRDLHPTGATPGGTVTFAAHAATRLGLRVALLTSAGPETDLVAVLPASIACLSIPAKRTTTFENIYHEGAREQFLHALATPLLPEYLPPDWQSAPLVHIAPVAAECSPRFCRVFCQATVLVTPQGWLRQWDTSGKVTPAPLQDADTVLSSTQVLVLSAADVGGDRELIRGWAKQVPFLVETLGPEGALLYQRDQPDQMPQHFPAYPVNEVDPTGAGDVFAIAWLIAYHRTGNPARATEFANCAASFVVEQPGLTGIPTAAQVEARLQRSSSP